MEWYYWLAGGLLYLAVGVPVVLLFLYTLEGRIDLEMGGNLKLYRIVLTAVLVFYQLIWPFLLAFIILFGPWRILQKKLPKNKSA